MVLGITPNTKFVYSLKSAQLVAQTFYVEERPGKISQPVSQLCQKAVNPYLPVE